MKIFKTLALALVSSFALCGLTACNSNDDNVQYSYVDFKKAGFTFNADNYWAACYDEAVGDVQADKFSFSHRAWIDADYKFPAWNGFCPSRVNDNKDYENDWTNHQWACVPANPANGIYLVGNSEAKVSENPLDNNKCSMRMVDYGRFTPQYAWVTNSTYAYYAAKNGTAFNEPFGIADRFVLHVVGVKSGAMTGHLQFNLMAQGEFLEDWALIPLASLGEVDEVLFYVDSNQKNAYGLKIPSYFCLTDITYTLPETSVSK